MSHVTIILSPCHKLAYVASCRIRNAHVVLSVLLLGVKDPYTAFDVL